MVTRFVMKSNKKQIISILAILTMAILLSCAFVACDKVDTDKTGTDIVADYKVTIHPNNGQGDIVWDITKEIPTITKEGYHIAGYFLDAQLTISTTLESLKATGITKNIDVYIKWEEDVCEHVAVTDAAVEPTCTEKGLTEGKHCSKCGKILTAQTEIDALGHDLETHNGQEATCTEKGWKAYVTCKREGCGYTTYQEIPALGHTEVVDDAIAPTCTEKGKTEGKHCSVCNTIIVAQTDIAALGHDLEHHNKKDATCTEPGWEAYDTCKRVGCGYTTYQEIPALGHKYSQEWSNDKTYHWHASTCGHDVVSDKGKHTFDSNWVCTECAYVDTGLHGIELRTNTLELDGTDIFGKVSNATSTFSFINEIAIADSAKYTVSTDINGLNVIPTKTVSLSIGDNTFYILVENGKDLGLYTVVIRRRPMYSVSFNVNGGTSVSSQTIEEDCFATEPTTERKGYAFDKWDYDFSEPIIKDTTITASWNIVMYNVYYDLNVPSDSISKDVDNSTNVTTYTVEDAITFKTPTRKGYRFTGWDKNIEEGTIGDVTVTASWEAIEYDIAYDFGDTDSVSKVKNLSEYPSTYTIEDAIAFVDPIRDGYEFKGFNIQSIASGTIGTKSITASWSIITYNISYDLNISSNSISQDVDNSMNSTIYTVEDAIAFSELARKGYTFIGWDKNIEKGTIGDITVTASWNAIEYSIIYDFGDGDSVSKATNNKKNPGKYTIEDTITFAAPARYGYTFVAWNMDRIVSGTTDTQTVVASWIIEQHTITYILSNEWTNSENNITTYTIEDQTITLHDAIKGESLFCGWYLDEECKNYIAIIDASTMCDYTVYAYADDSATKGLSIENGIVKGYSGTLTDVVIPSYYKGCSVTSIGHDAFEDCTSLTSVTIPDSVTSIGNYAFSGCTGLTSITIPSSVTSIGYSAFSGCSGLTSITIPDSVTSIGSSAFRGCNGLTSITLPFVGASETANDGYDQVFGYIFGYTSSSGSSVSGATYQYHNNSKYYYFYYIPSSIESITITGENIPKNAFYNCSGLRNVTIGNGVTSIGDRAFYDCTGLTSVTIGNSVTSIGNYAFSGCSSLTSIHYTGDIAGWCGISGLVSLMSSSRTLYIDGKNVEGELRIPDTVTSIGNHAFYCCTGLTSVTIGNSVTSIGSSVFRGCNGLTSVTIPDSVTSIGDDAFYNCSKLQSIYITDIASWCNISGLSYLMWYSSNNKSLYLINELITSATIPEGVTAIPSYAFYKCSSLTSITIPDSVTSIGNSAFSGCGLTSITIPDSVTSIGNYAFEDCTSLTSVTIGNSVTSIGERAFYYCTGLTRVTIGNSVTSIGDNAFSGCSKLQDIYITDIATWCNISGLKNLMSYGPSKNLYINNELVTSVTIPDGVTIIPSSAFEDCTSLTSITIPDSVTSIGNGAFHHCTGLTSVTIPDSVTSIGVSAFSGCNGLTSVTIPDSVTSIGSYAFLNCSGLTSVTIGNGVTSIGDSAFRGCYKLIEVYNKSTLSITAGSSSNGYVAYYAKNVYTNEGGSKLSPDENGYVIYTEGDQKILVAYHGTNTELILPLDITIIYQYAFYNCKGLTSVTIPDSVTSIGDYAFYKCTNLTSIEIPNGVTGIGNDAFSGCSSLTSITIGNSVTSIGDYAFSGCSGLTSITISDSVTSIGNSAFYGCSGLTSITISDNVTSIGDCAFCGCSGLTSIVIPNSVTSIGDSAFAYCTGLTNATIPDSVTSIGEYAFNGCSGLTSVTIGNSVTGIGRSAFKGCADLTTVNWNATECASAGSDNYPIFYGCSNLTTVNIGDNVTTIPSDAFRGCKGLTSVTIPDSVTSIGSDAFRGCTSLTSITIGGSVTSIGNYAFDSCTGLTNIKFNGTIAQWNAISKGAFWKAGIPATQVICTDGTISI